MDHPNKSQLDAIADELRNMLPDTQGFTLIVFDKDTSHDNPEIQVSIVSTETPAQVERRFIEIIKKMGNDLIAFAHRLN